MAQLSRLVQITSVLQAKYDVVVTNPPYLNKMDKTLKSYVKKYYKDYSGDLFSVFIWLNSTMTVKDGYSAYMTPFVWMFIKTYEALRTKILDTVSISSLIQMEYSAFEEATVPIDTFVLKNSHDQIGSYVKLSAFKGGMEVQRQKVLEAINDPDCKYLYRANQANFENIPGSPISYWACLQDFSNYRNMKVLDNVAFVRKGMFTGDNEKFIRNWSEVNFLQIQFTISNHQAILPRGFVPLNKGGAYRKWSGNHSSVIKFDNEAYSEIDNNKGHRSPQFYFMPNITWTKITSGAPSFRFSKGGFINNDASMIIFEGEEVDLFSILAIVNSKVAQHYLSILNEGLNYTAGDIARIPMVLTSQSRAREISMENINISTIDWNSEEVSWNFSNNVFVEYIDEHTLALLKKIGQIRPFAPNLCQIINHIKQRSVE